MNVFFAGYDGLALVGGRSRENYYRQSDISVRFGSGSVRVRCLFGSVAVRCVSVSVRFGSVSVRCGSVRLRCRKHLLHGFRYNYQSNILLYLSAHPFNRMACPGSQAPDPWALPLIGAPSRGLVVRPTSTARRIFVMGHVRTDGHPCVQLGRRLRPG